MEGLAFLGALREYFSAAWDGLVVLLVALYYWEIALLCGD